MWLAACKRKRCNHTRVLQPSPSPSFFPPPFANMEGDMYDEFGNYIGPELESDESEEENEEEEQEEGHVADDLPEVRTRGRC